MEKKNMNKNKLLNLKKKLLVCGSMVTLGATALTGCQGKPTVEEAIVQEEEFDLISEQFCWEYFIINTTDISGIENYYFTKRISIRNLTKNYNEGTNFSNKNDFKKYNRDEFVFYSPLLYFDVFTGELVSVEYTEHAKFADSIENYYKHTYLINEITDKDFAYNYAVSYIDKKETYTEEEMKELIDTLNANNKTKTLTK